MFFVNDQYYTVVDVEKQHARFEEMEILQNVHQKRIAVCLPDAFEWLSLCLYMQKKGGSVVPINPATPKEAALRFANATSSHVLLFESLESPIELSSKENEKEGVLVQMSSGTTGEPKCIERSWDSIEEELESYVANWPMSNDTTSIVACPVTHSYGLISGVLSCLKRGAEPIVITNMNPKYVIKKVVKHPTHILYGAPALIHTVVQLLPKGQRLHAVMTSGTVIPASWLSSLHQVADRVLQQYGCSEAGCVALHPNVMSPEDMGYALSHVNISAGKDKNHLAEIVIRTSLQDIYTKDLGYLKEDGTLCYVSRMDDTINVAGLNVYPQEVENVLMAEPRIEEAVVYKKSDAYAGERVCVQFVSNETIDEMELREWCKNRLSPYQVPVEFVQVKEIAKLPNGKVSRKLLGGVPV
ncbi:AMP-binding protein [Metabacillus iocasae]|uniref:Fatty-acyl-CoA synthase n=1 Tax=Priestia iocasae TaxID=2291674 RepID=A0ABS2QYI0_9BACI|nr:AMP-binding protein [Metabacillus iocasae]MBM7704549.1 fatty-acyl-CoA synthase [Metabacillus iocasae]